MNRFMRWFYQWAVPHFVLPRINRLLPWVAFFTLILLGVGVVWSLVFAPADYQQGNAFRIIYVHVPAAWLSVLVYLVMAAAALAVLVWRVALAELVVQSAAVIGGVFTLIVLLTGAIWGKPMWGAWWVWDARLTSELILLFVYLGVYGVFQGIENRVFAARAASLIALVGLVNLPIIHYSVIWWNTLHQPPSLSKFAAPSIHPEMLWPLLVMLLAFCGVFIWLLLLQLRLRLVERHRASGWLRKFLEDA